MPRPEPRKKPLLFLCCCFFAGALIVASVTALERSFYDLPIELGQRWLSIIVGGIIGILFGRSDIRTRVIHHSLENSKKSFRHLYQKTPAMLHSMDTAGHLLYVSQLWLETLGYEREDVIGKDFFEFVIDDNIDKLRTEHFNRLKVLGEIRDSNYLLRQKDGSSIALAISEVAQWDADGQLTESLAVFTDLTNQRAAEERIEKLAYYDPLTGLPNRALMNDRILQSVALARRDNRQVGVFFFDLDRFKLINDTQGHAVGDMVLRSVAQRLKKFIREGDTFARLGGDEFVIIQADPNHDPNFTTMGRRILETLGLPFQIGSREFFTTASIGVAIYPVDGDDPQTLLKSADTAMYVAKSRGRDNIQFFSDDMNAAAIAKTNLESRLRQALSRGELQQHYQPQIDLATGKVSGVEALLRWYDLDGKLIPPREIISVAEESGLVFPLGEWVLRTACTQSKTWQEDGLPPLRMAVNLSGHHIRQANFIDHIEEILKDTGIAFNGLEIEMAENSVMGHVNDSIMALTDLKIRGISLAIDDFGTGYSSLLYLKHFPIHRIKIGQDFVRDIIHNPDYAAIAEAILLMAKSLNMSVTAVGVEDPKQLDFLRERGCDEVQGKLFGSAMNAEEMTAFLKETSLLPRTFGRKTGPEKIKVEGSKIIH
jgi:diguanylate cyclase (GGDEF)-like protein/PAS domain S-box-containing protein